EVAGPDRCLATAKADVNADNDLVALHVGGSVGFRIVWIALSLDGDTNVAEPDGKQIAISRLAGLANSHHDTTPIGILARHRGLDERRIGDRQRDALCRTCRLGTRNGDFHLLTRTFAI